MKRARADFGIVCRMQPIRYRLSHLFKKTFLPKRDFQYIDRDEYYRLYSAPLTLILTAKYASSPFFSFPADHGIRKQVFLNALTKNLPFELFESQATPKAKGLIRHCRAIDFRCDLAVGAAFNFNMYRLKSRKVVVLPHPGELKKIGPSPEV